MANHHAHIVNHLSSIRDHSGSFSMKRKQAKNRIVIPYCRSSDSRISRIAFIPEADLLKLIKNRVSNADDFLLDIMNGKFPKVTVGKSSKKLAVIDLDCKTAIVERDGKYYDITVLEH